MSSNGEHFSKQRVFAWPEFFRSGMMWGSSKQSQLRRDRPRVATALDEYIIAKSLVEPILYIIRHSWRMTGYSSLIL